jgi:site-specific DNA-methyltransferase (adenine-specific)
MPDYQLFLGDCLDVMPTLEAGSVDVVVTDPPFNAGKEFANDNLSDLDFRAFCNHFVLQLYRLQPLNILVEVGKNDQIMRQELERYFTFRYSLCLNYTNSMRNGAVGYANWGLVLWFSNGGKCYQRYKDRLDSALHNTKAEFTHPSPKEVEHYRHLVRMFTPEGGTVLDPFMGSGTTGIACLNTERRFIGIEQNAEYYSIAEKRLQDTVNA